MFPRNENRNMGYVRMFPRKENRNEGTVAKITLLRNRPLSSGDVPQGGTRRRDADKLWARIREKKKRINSDYRASWSRQNCDLELGRKKANQQWLSAQVSGPKWLQSFLKVTPRWRKQSKKPLLSYF